MICGGVRRVARFWGWAMVLLRRARRLLSNSSDILSIIARPRGTLILLREDFKSRVGSDGGGLSPITSPMIALTRKSILRVYQTHSVCIWTRTARNPIVATVGTLLYLVLCLGSLSKPSYLTIRGSLGLLGCQLGSHQERVSLLRRIIG